MREKIIANHNSVVRPGDRVYHVGDMFWRTLSVGEAVAIRYRLNGEHYYVFGNHDELFRNQIVRDAFVWCRERENLKIHGYPNIVLDHYAGRVWHGSHRGAWQLYGHTHNDLPEDGSLSFDVGVDAQNYFPISLEEVSAKMKKKTEAFSGKTFVCPKCDNKFVPYHTRPSICSKCSTPMKLR
jgi:calcineurin-like phosphoesterase family protein